MDGDGTLLHKAALVWHELSQHKYSLTYGYKMKLYTINLSFSPEDFPHLAGFQYLKDLTLPRFTPAKTVNKILDGTITQAQVEKGFQYEKMVKPHLLALVALEESLVSDCICCSTFRKDERNYEQNQRPLTLLKKVKTKLLTNETQILFLKDDFKDKEATETADNSAFENAGASDCTDNAADA